MLVQYACFAIFVVDITLAERFLIETVQSRDSIEHFLIDISC